MNWATTARPAEPQPGIDGAVAGSIDLPASGAVLDVRQPLTVGGWAYGVAEPVQFVDVFLDDQHLGRVVPDEVRPDVAQALGTPDAHQSGFTFSVSLPPGLPRQAHLRALAALADGTSEEVGSVAVVFRPVVVGGIDLAPGAALDPGAIRVPGWAYGPIVPVARVGVYIGGRWLGRAGLGRVRPDVAEATGSADASLSGFELELSRPVPLAPGRAEVKAVVTLVDGTEEELGAVAVDIRPRPAQSEPEAPADPVRPTRRPRGKSDLIRVLWSARGLDQGGSQLRMAELIEHLHRQGGFRSTVIAPVDGPLRDRLEAAGATVELTPAAPLDDVAGYERVVSGITSRAREFDLVAGFTVTSFPAVDAGARVGLPTVLRLGEAAPLRTVVRWLFGALDPEVEKRARSVIGSASVVVSNSYAAVETYRAEGYEGRFVVVPTGVEVGPEPVSAGSATRVECRRRLGIGAEERMLLCPASLWPIKGQAVLVAALRLLHGRHPQLSCALIGHEAGAYADTIGTFVERNGLSGVVRIRPFEADLEPWWRSADVVACASETEAMPAAVLEGMAHGLPALATRVGDLARLVEPHANGWLCDHSDVAAMAAALEAVAGMSPESLRRMGTAAAAAVARSHDLVQAMDRWTELLRSAVDAGVTLRAAGWGCLP